MAILQIKDSVSGEWIEVSALRGDSGKSAYEIAVTGGYTGTEADYESVLSSLDEFAKISYVDEKTADSLKYKGSVENSIELNSIKDPENGEVYYNKEDSKTYVWNGSEWEVFGGTVDLSGYGTIIYINQKIEEEQLAREAAEKVITEALAAEALARETRDNELEALIKEREAADLLILEALTANGEADKELTEQVSKNEEVLNELKEEAEDKYTELKNETSSLKELLENIGDNLEIEHNSLEGRDAEDCHTIESITGLRDELDEVGDGFEDRFITIEDNIAILEDTRAFKNDVYTKEEVDELLGEVYKYKGTVESESSLPADAEKGDIYVNIENNSSYVWNGTDWDNLGPMINLDGLATDEDLALTESQLEDKINELKESIGEGTSSQLEEVKETIGKIEEELDSKANIEDVYTKVETDELLDKKQDNLTAGFGIILDEATGLIETEKLISIPNYDEASNYTSLPFTAKEICSVVGSVYSRGGGYTIKINDSVVLTGQGWSNFTLNLNEGDILSSDDTIDEINLSVSALSNSIIPDRELAIATPTYEAALDLTELPYKTTKNCFIMGSVYGVGGGYTLSIDGIDIASGSGWTNLNIPLKENQTLTCDMILDVVNLKVAPVEAISAGETVVDLVDNLVSTSTTEALTANQGRILNEMKEDVSFKEVSGVDANEVKSNSKLYVTSATNTPSTSGFLIHEGRPGYEDAYAIQTFIKISGETPQTYQRILFSSVFQDWTLVETHRVGDVIITKTNTDPSDDFGGTWELFDKGFRNEYIYTSSPTEYFTDDVGSCSNIAIKRGGNTIQIRVGFVGGDADFDDSTVVIGYINQEAIGANSFLNTQYSLAQGDTANGLLQVILAFSTGALSVVDIISKSGASTMDSSATYSTHVVILITPDQMIDEFCDKFYWRKTSN